eukprot:Awhi_evm1s9319
MYTHDGARIWDRQTNKITTVMCSVYINKNSTEIPTLEFPRPQPTNPMPAKTYHSISGTALYPVQMQSSKRKNKPKTKDSKKAQYPVHPVPNVKSKLKRVFKWVDNIANPKVVKVSDVLNEKQNDVTENINDNSSTSHEATSSSPDFTGCDQEVIDLYTRSAGSILIC